MDSARKVLGFGGTSSESIPTNMHLLGLQPLPQACGCVGILSSICLGGVGFGGEAADGVGAVSSQMSSPRAEASLLGQQSPTESKW